MAATLLCLFILVDPDPSCYQCSGDRPRCRRCGQKGFDCHYAAKVGETTGQALRRSLGDMEKKATMSEELLELLKTLPDQQALDVIRRLRNGDNAETVLNHMKTGDALIELAVDPEARFRYEFPYRTEMPRHYYFNNPYLDSVIYEATSLYPGRQASGPQTGSTTSGSQGDGSLYVKPFHAASVIDSMLSEVDVAAWTNVCDDNKLMRSLLEGFFLCEYQLTSAFQKNHLLEDMAAHRQDFCSSLLVNVILAYSCVSPISRLYPTNASLDSLLLFLILRFVIPGYLNVLSIGTPRRLPTASSWRQNASGSSKPPDLE